MSFLHDRVLDNGLSVLTSEVNKLTICSQEPQTFAQANATYALGSKVSPTVSSPVAATPTGRKVTVSAVSDGAVSASGTATHWALLDTANSRLLAASALAGSQSVVNGNTFSLTAFDVAMPGP